MVKKYLILVTLFLMTSAASAANITWHGGVDYRYSELGINDNLDQEEEIDGSMESISESTDKSHMYRMGLGAMGGWDNVEWGVTVGTIGPEGTANSDWTEANVRGAGAGSDLSLGVREAWLRYGNDWGFGDVGLTFGRQMLPFSSGSNQVFWDKDVRLDGFSQTWKWGSFGLNLGQYILGSVEDNEIRGSSFEETPKDEKNPSLQNGFSALYGFQGTFDWRFNDDFMMNFAAGMYQWSRTLGPQYQNTIPNSNGLGLDSARDRVSQENSRHWAFLLGLDMPYSLNLEYELVFNREILYGAPPAAIGAPFAPDDDNEAQDSTAWSLGLTYGELKKAHDFMIGYAYQDKGLGAVSNRFTYEFHPAGFSGHHLWAKYSLANNFNLGLKYNSLSEKDPRDQNGAELISIDGKDEKIDRSYWEFTTGIMF